MKAARARVFTVVCFIALAFQTIGTSAGSQEKYGKYYPQYSSQSYQQPYTSNRFFENSAIKQHFKNLWNRQTDYQQPYYNRDRYSGIPDDTKQQNYESIPQTDAVTQKMLPEENDVKQSPTSSTPHISKLDDDIPNVSKSSEPLDDSQPNPQILTERPQQHTEDNVQTLDQIPQNNEPQTRYKREFSSQQSSDSAMYQKEVNEKKSSHKRHRSRQKHNTRLKPEGNKESKTYITTKNPSRTSQRSKGRLKEKENLEATTETKHKIKQGIQKSIEDAEVTTDRGVGKRNVHKVTKEIASKKHKNIFNTLIDILIGQKSTYDVSNAENKVSELDKDFNFIEQSSIKPTSESVQTTFEKSLSDETSPEPTQYTTTHIEQVSTEETKQSSSDQGTSTLIDKPSSQAPLREPTQSIFTPVELASSDTPDAADKTSNQDPAPQVIQTTLTSFSSEMTEQFNSDQPFPVLANKPLSEESFSEPTQYTFTPVELDSTEMPEQPNLNQATSISRDEASSEKPSQILVEQVSITTSEQPKPEQFTSSPANNASSEELSRQQTQTTLTPFEQISTKTSEQSKPEQVTSVPANNTSSEELSSQLTQITLIPVEQISTKTSEQSKPEQVTSVPANNTSSEELSSQLTQITLIPVEQISTKTSEQSKPEQVTSVPANNTSSEEPSSQQTQTTLTPVDQVLTKTSEQSKPEQVTSVPANNTSSEESSFDRIQFTPLSVKSVSTEQTEQITFTLASTTPSDKLSSENSSFQPTQSPFTPFEQVLTEKTTPTSIRKSSIEPFQFTLAPVEQNSTEQSEKPTPEQGTLVLPDKPSNKPLPFVPTQSTLSPIERVSTETSESTPSQTIRVAANKSLSEQPSSEQTQSTLTSVVQVSTEKTEQRTTIQATPIPVDGATSEDLSSLSTQSTFITTEYVSTTQFEQPTMKSSRVLITQNLRETSTEFSEQDSLETTQLITPIDLAPKQSEHSTMIIESTTSPSTLQDFQPRFLVTMKETKPEDLTQSIQEITTTDNEIERMGGYDLSKINDKREIKKAIESDIKLRTLIVPDKRKPGGHCYCSCEMNSRPVFITLD